MAAKPQANIVSRTCPLCYTVQTNLFLQETMREYRRCPNCALTFVPAAYHLSRQDEHARYQTHQNRSDDLKYRAFLDRLARHLVPKLSPGAVGLDYGSGPGPTLSVMLEEQGFVMRIYDPYFAPDKTALNGNYDFITCTETVEHFAQPGREFAIFKRLLHTVGWLAVMTQILESDELFDGWWYRNDPTHVCFYRPETMCWIATRFGWRMENPAPNITLFLSEY